MLTLDQKITAAEEKIAEEERKIVQLETRIAQQDFNNESLIMYTTSLINNLATLRKGLFLLQEEKTRLESSLAVTNANNSNSASTTPTMSPDSYFHNSFQFEYVSLLQLNMVEVLETVCVNYARFSRDASEATFYSRYFAMVQSSGVGKSRLVCELAKRGKETFVVYINLRTSIGEPSRTPIIADFIDKNIHANHEWDDLFQAIGCALDTHVSLTDVASEEARSRFYDLLNSNAQNEDHSFWRNVVYHYENFHKLRAGSEHQLNRSCRKCNVLGEKVLVVVFDECAVSFTRRQSEHVASTRLTELQQALVYENATPCAMVAILIDTTSTIGNCAPSDRRHSSSRVLSGNRLNPPFIHFPINLSPQLTVPANVRQFRLDIALLNGAEEPFHVLYNPLEEVLCCRSLLATPVCNYEKWRPGSNPMELFDYICTLISSKLVTRNVTVHKFSYASIRWDVTSLSRFMNETLVSQCLALISEMSPKMEHIWCRYAFEPAVARFVASLMVRSESSTFADVVEELVRQQAEGLLEWKEGKGDQGEMVAVILLSRAQDVAWREVMRSPHIPRIQYPEAYAYGPVLLRSWLTQLFEDGDELWEKILNDCPSMQHAVVYFHSARRMHPTQKEITKELVLWYFQRGTMLIAPSGKAATDLFVPFAIPVSSDKVDLMDPASYSLGLIPIQVKNVMKSLNDNELMRAMFETSEITMFGDNVPRFGMILYMNPDMSLSKKRKRYLCRKDDAGNPQYLGVVKHFKLPSPCLQADERSLKTLKAMLRIVPYVAKTEHVFQEYNRKFELGPALTAAKEYFARELFAVKAHSPSDESDFISEGTERAAAVAADEVVAKQEEEDEDEEQVTAALVAEVGTHEKGKTKARKRKKKRHFSNI